MKASGQILEAALLGTAAFNESRKCVPAHDSTLLEMFVGRDVGITPAGEASTVAILKAWSKAWHDANLAAPVPAIA